MKKELRMESVSVRERERGDREKKVRERYSVFDISFPLEGLSGTVEQCMASPLLASAVKRDNQSYNSSARPKKLT